jgi:hypothetical protein
VATTKWWLGIRKKDMFANKPAESAQRHAIVRLSRLARNPSAARLLDYTGQ